MLGWPFPFCWRRGTTTDSEGQGEIKTDKSERDEMKRETAVRGVYVSRGRRWKRRGGSVAVDGVLGLCRAYVRDK